MSAVVSDTSPLHYLVLCGAVDLLPALFGEVLIPPKVAQELRHCRTPAAVRDWLATAPNWLKVQAPSRVDLALPVDAGEGEAICLALEVGARALLIDDRKGRTTAGRLGLAVIGTLGILDAASKRGLVDLATVIDRLRHSNARLDPELLTTLLRKTS